MKITFISDNKELNWKSTSAKTISAMWKIAREYRDTIKSLNINSVPLMDCEEFIVEFRKSSSGNIMMKKIEKTKIEPTQTIQNMVTNDSYEPFKFLSPSLVKIWKETEKMSRENDK